MEFFITDEEDDGENDVNEYGLFDYKYLDHYWTEEGRYRRQGIAKEAVFKVFEMYKGNWSVSWLEKNVPAKTFWTKVIQEYSDGICSESIQVGMPSLEFISL